jgi:DNA-binding MarR family transcriptional regulator
MRGAWAWGMDAILFGLKRAHHASLRFGHAVLAPFGLTPARFDAMFALHREGGFMAQSKLRRSLGIARSTMTRMLVSLERLGLLERTPRRYTRLVRMTQVGASVVRRAAGYVLGRYVAYRTVARAIRLGPRSPHLQTRGHFDSLLSKFRRTLGDRATLYYPWDPDD